MKQKTFTITTTAVLAALLILMTFTGIGYIPIPPLQLTILTLPVAIGAVMCGPYTGLILGLVFGLTSFAQALFGINTLCALLLSFGGKYAVFLLITCLVPRLICGWLPAFLHQKWKTKNETLSVAVNCALVAILNTVLFITFFWLFFGAELQSNPAVVKEAGGAIRSLWMLFVTWAGVNGLIEVGVNLVVGTAIVTALKPAIHRFH